MSFQPDLTTDSLNPRPAACWSRRRFLTHGGMTMAGLLLAGGAHAAAAVAPESLALADAAPYRRLLWITRWDYRSASDVATILRNAASARFSDVLFQVRGEGTVFYRSQLEPWAWELTGNNAASTGTDPGWDPLATAIDEASRYGLRLHAYLNVMPGWSQAQVAPAASGQLFSVHRSWFMMDAKGRRMDPARGGELRYAFVDPALPEVRRHLALLAGEVAARYRIDGIHLDYFRYPFENGEYSYHPAALEQFREAFGKAPAALPEEWAQFRRDQVTETLKEISATARQARPELLLTSAIIADPGKRRNLAMQDAERWVREKLVDAVLPMAYTGDMQVFAGYCAAYTGGDWTGRVWPGLWADARRNAHLIEQLRSTVKQSFPGIAIFSYSELFPGAKASPKAVDVYKTFVDRSL